MSKIKIVILAARYYNHKMELTIGGIQSYMTKMAEGLSSLYDVYIVQKHEVPFKINNNDYTVIGVNESTDLYAKREILREDDIIICSTENIDISIKWPKMILIQHGIYWDLPVKLVSNSFIAKLFPNVYHFLDMYRIFKKFRRFSKIVTVDYNVYNHFKCINPQSKRSVNVIPNFVDDRFFEYKRNFTSQKNDKVRVLIARRFFKMRGVLIVAEAIEKFNINNPKNNVEFIFSGEGPEEKKLQELASNHFNVKVVKTSFAEMPNLMAKCDVSIIPSIGSEGTSLSLLEAMGSGHLTLCTPVGGMSNIIIDRFNGYFFYPCVDDLYQKLKFILDSFPEQNHIRMNAISTAKNGFSYSIWINKWKQEIAKFQK
ncbi:glycosyltransferase family 4 protein [Vibrio antiquarius]|uniref:glycosyltransferase family 4 protein n=3 Tax=Vibrio antiquarius (strain Ex25) TaxID=150340 RepID=UPI002659C5A7|nr:glycosyltransferase family 4 protein [Vibrio antiquarius]MCR9911432.1 glycosyltransferase family 4 protein [Vibrio antiquarius]